MTVLESWATGRQTRAERRSGRPPRTPVLTLAGRYFPLWVNVRRFLAYVTGFGLVDAAAWQFATWSGLLVAGLAILALDFLCGDE